jgi:predicted HTH domain antitoxin
MYGVRERIGATVTAKTITLELPEVDLLGPPNAIAGRVRESLVLDLLRDAQITQGQAARLLNVTRYDILDLMARHAIPSGPQTAEEAQRDVEAARLGVSPAKTDAGG